MKALMKTRTGYGNLELLDIPEPLVDAAGILIQVHYAGICGTDLHILHGSYNCSPPIVLGHECAGIVKAVGPLVNNVQVHDRVMLLPANGWTCQQCDYCRKGYYMFCPSRRGLGINMHGCFTKYVVVKEDMVFKVPSGVSLREAALAEPLACALQAVEELTPINGGEKVLLSGPGPVGLLCLMMLVEKGCSVIVSGTSQDAFRLDLARQFGAARVVDIWQENILEVVSEFTGGYGVDIVFECSGAPSAVSAGLQAVRKMGRYIQLGILGSEVELDFDTILFKQLQVFGSYGHSLNTWRKVPEWMNRRADVLSQLITHVFPLSQWQQAFDLCENKQCGKVLLYYDGDEM
ncbi:MAG: alcohol dehydrogenase catalytic domain-containing protein [Bacillota bacterium]|nr:Zn-dependent alcohol dehydrogenase [Bacillota bacterium]